MKKLLFLFIVMLLAGCASTAGPFVTSIGSDVSGNLTVEKCMVEFSPTMSTVQNSNCSSTTIKIRQ